MARMTDHEWAVRHVQETQREILRTIADRLRNAWTLSDAAGDLPQHAAQLNLAANTMRSVVLALRGVKEILDGVLGDLRARGGGVVANGESMVTAKPGPCDDDCDGTWTGKSPTFPMEGQILDLCDIHADAWRSEASLVLTQRRILEAIADRRADADSLTVAAGTFPDHAGPLGDAARRMRDVATRLIAIEYDVSVVLDQLSIHRGDH